MNALIKKVKGTTSNSRNAAIKRAITTQLSECVKEIQLCGVEDNILSDSLDIDDATNTLCSVIEAMFLHGLKDSLAHRFRRVIADVDDRPEPNFWAPLLVISHGQIIKQITDKSSQLTTEVGQCRAWVRLALNDCLLSSYLMIIRQVSNALNSYYNTYAYVRDSELLEVAQKLIEGVEAVKTFDLPCFSSILNTWPQSTLMLAEIWSPTLRACPVQQCVDVMQSSQLTNIGQSESVSSGSMLSLHSRSSGIGHILALNEDDALKIILAKHQIQENTSSNNSQDGSISEVSDTETKSVENEQIVQVESNLGNSLNRRTGWSFDESQQNGEHFQPEGAQSLINETRAADNTKSLEHSYNDLIESYNMFSGAYIRTPDLREMWQRFETTDSKRRQTLEEKQTDLTNKHLISDIEINNEGSRKNALSLATQLITISRERGLDSQNYECAGCETSFKLPITASVCSFTGGYFCNDCMCKESIVIPARIVHNWDYKEYRVSQKAFNYLTEIKDHPSIDLKTVNPYIYVAVGELARLQILRNQLNFLRAYLFTCRDPVMEEFQKLMWPREYLYEHIHQYSISDLLLIPYGTLEKQLSDVVSFGKKHVFDCWSCSNKGFLCEVCKKSKVLFPFDVENVYRCDVCNAVYHIGCQNASKPCPKCKRKKERDIGFLGEQNNEDS